MTAPAEHRRKSVQEASISRPEGRLFFFWVSRAGSGLQA
jgi:hypothetical protein